MSAEPTTSRTISVDVNGDVYERDVDARRLLVHFIRDELELTGTHIGCDTGNCGACTVHLGRRHDLRVRRHRAELERVARDGDRAQLLEPVQVDDHVRGGGSGLHHVDERLAAGERSGALVRAQQPNRLFDRGRPRIFDLAKKHGGITPISL